MLFFSNVRIKKEPLEESENREPEQVLNVRIKQEREDDLDEEATSIVDNAVYNNRDHNETLGDGSTCSDITSEESSFDSRIYGPSVDFSDVPRGSTKDEDSMSLFADETFEDESDELTRKR